MTTAIRGTVESRGAQERGILAKYRGGKKPRFHAVLKPRFDPIVTHFYQSALIYLAVNRGFYTDTAAVQYVTAVELKTPRWTPVLLRKFFRG